MKLCGSYFAFLQIDRTEGLHLYTKQTMIHFYNAKQRRTSSWSFYSLLFFNCFCLFIQLLRCRLSRWERV